MEVGNAMDPKYGGAIVQRTLTHDLACLMIFSDLTRMEHLVSNKTKPGWNGTSPDACGTPVAPHDGSAAATYTSDATSITLMEQVLT